MEPKAKAFICYSRADLTFSDGLVAALQERGFEALIDRSDIAAGEDWSSRIRDLIAQADTIVFVISPEAIASKVCNDEIAFGVSLNKRFVPIVWRRVSAREIPKELGDLQWIFFDDPARFNASMGLLTDALETDIQWIRKHTEFGEHARRWLEAGRPGPRGLLLRSPLLEDAERWIASRPQNAPHPTKATQDFIAESRRATTRRRNVLTASLAAGFAVAVILAGDAFWQRTVALTNEDIAKQQTAIASERLSESQRRESLFLAQAARQELASGNSLTALQLSLQGLPKGNDRPFLPEIFGALVESFNDQRLKAALQDNYRRDTAQNYAAFSRSATFSRDGKHVLATSYDGTASLWDVSTGQQIARLQIKDPKVEHGIEIRTAVFTPDSARILTTSTDNIPRLWDAKTGTEVMSIHVPGTGAVGAIPSPDGSRIFVSRGDANWAWNSFNGEHLETLPLHQAFNNSSDIGHDSTLISSDGRLALTISGREFLSGDRKAQLWEIASGRNIATIGDPKGSVNSAEFSSDGKKIITASTDNTAQIWDATTGTRITILRGHEKDVVSAKFSPDGKFALTASNDRTARLWDVVTGKEIVTFRGHQDELYSAAFSPDGSLIVTVAADDTVRIWDPASGAELENVNGHIFEVEAAEFSPDGNCVLTTSKDQRLNLWQIVDLHKAVVLNGHEGVINSASFSNDGKSLITASMDGTARVWNSLTGQVTSLLQGNDGPIFSAKFFRVGDQDNAVTNDGGGSTLWSFTETGLKRIPVHGLISPDIKHVLVSLSNSETALFDASTRQEIPLSTPDGHSVQFATFSSTGRHVLGYNVKDERYLWDAYSGRYIGELVFHSDRSDEIQFAFSLNDTRILAWSEYSKVVLLWDANSGRKEPGELSNSNYPRVVLFNPNATTIATCSLDGAVQLWDVTSKKKIADLRGHEGAIINAVYSPDGARLLTISRDHTVRLWDAFAGRELAVLRFAIEVQAQAATFSPDGSRILLVLDDNTARVLWIGKTVDEFIEYARKTLPQEMTPEDKLKYYVSVDDKDGVQNEVRVSK
jgi:WD40 repeat protein